MDQHNKGHRPKEFIIRFLHPGVKPGIAITIIMSIGVLISVNFICYIYLQAYPLSSEINAGAIATINQWHGLKTLPSNVDNLLMGDSDSVFNLSTGPFTDRLGGDTIQLGNISTSSFLMDAWMLSAFIQNYGAPKNVVIVRSFTAYSFKHNLEYMSLMPLPWNYWQHYGVSPVWEKGEIWRLFIDKYFVLYSNKDRLRNRFMKPSNLLRYRYIPVKPSQVYTVGNAARQEPMDLAQRLPKHYFQAFSTCKDTHNALRFICDLARLKHFQVYILFQPEWDEAREAGLRSQQIEDLSLYLSQFADPLYVHIVRDDSLVFCKDQMQNTQHLRPGADHIFTETYIENITSIQNQLTSYKFQPLNLISVLLDKNEYSTGDNPVISLQVLNEGHRDVKGGISCLVRPAGKRDGEWIVRAPAKTVHIPSGGNIQMNLELNVGQLSNPGTYDLIIYLRQDLDQLSHETRIEILDKINVN